MITGSIVALVTPMRAESLDIDWPSLKELVEWHVQQGTNGIVAVGTTGESATLNVSEHKEVIKVVVDQVAGRVPVIAGTGANSTAEAIILTKAAKESGADACLLVTPYYNKPTQEGLYVHYKTIAEAVDIDQILYNVPGRTACDMQPDTVARLSKLDNIVGIKEATGDLSRVGVLKADCADGFAIYSGDDVTARELMLMGGHGDISVTANVAPKLMSDMCAAAIAGDTELAAKIDMSLAALHTALFLESNPIPVKWAVSQMGLMDNVLRLPMTPLSREHQNTVGAALNAAGITK
ncbi:MAG: 4-hydroxy-tetrahydrodipicolinate synthase [Porticoccaceae bacterium]|jgi:4-hydroxy-tetrahydrodipicolinate synthase|nr:4-hydroxy-tetrahydrodipicolinate synthase [Porticoccaceae bacterium]